MIDEVPYGYSTGKFGRIAGMVGVVVRNNDIIEDCDIRLLQNSRDPVSVARDSRRVRLRRSRRALIPWESRIHQHRLSGTRYEERGLAAFGIDEINIQRFLRRLLALEQLNQPQKRRLRGDSRIIQHL